VSDGDNHSQLLCSTNNATLKRVLANAKFCSRKSRTAIPANDTLEQTENTVVICARAWGKGAPSSVSNTIFRKWACRSTLRSSLSRTWSTADLTASRSLDPLSRKLVQYRDRACWRQRVSISSWSAACLQNPARLSLALIGGSFPVQPV